MGASMLKLVPWDDRWVTPVTDMKAIYLRPHRTENERGDLEQTRDVHGEPEWDTVTLAIKHHQKWASKGYKYLTLADRESLQTAAKRGMLAGMYRDYDQHVTGGPWDWFLYRDSLKQTSSDKRAELQKDVDEFGWQAVEKIRQRTDPTFRVPDSMKPQAKAVDEAERVEEVTFHKTPIAEHVEFTDVPRRRRGRPRKTQPEPVA